MNVTDEIIYDALSDSWKMAHDKEVSWAGVLFQVGYIATMVAKLPATRNTAERMRELLLLTNIASYHLTKEREK